MNHEPHTIVGLRAENFKRIVAVELHPTATGLVELRGRNGQGKSSVIDSIAAALGGARACPAKPIRDGEASAEVEIDLGDLIVRRCWTDPGDPTKNYLAVEGKDGAQFRSPQAVLDRLTGEFADPVEFVRLKPAEQVQAVLGMVELGIDLEASRAAEKDVEQDRLLIGREVRNLAGEVDGLKAAAAGAPEARVEIADLSRQLAEAHEHNAGLARLEAQARQEKRDRQVAEAAVDVCRKRLSEIRQRIAELEAEARDVESRAIPRVEAALTEAQAKAEAADNAVAAFVPRDVTEIQERMSRAEANNRHAEAGERHRARAAALAAKRAEHEAVEANIREIREARRTALEAVAFPVEGMGYDPDGGTLTLAGVPFAQASQAEQLRASAELAMARDPAIRVLIVREGSLLDSAHKAMLAELVTARGYQLWLECVADGPGGVGVYIEAGQIVAAAAAAQEAA